MLIIKAGVTLEGASGLPSEIRIRADPQGEALGRFRCRRYRQDVCPYLRATMSTNYMSSTEPPT